MPSEAAWMNWLWPFVDLTMWICLKGMSTRCTKAPSERTRSAGSESKKVRIKQVGEQQNGLQNLPRVAEHQFVLEASQPPYKLYSSVSKVLHRLITIAAVGKVQACCRE